MTIFTLLSTIFIYQKTSISGSESTMYKPTLITKILLVICIMFLIILSLNNLAISDINDNITDIDKTPEQFIECMRKLRVKPENTLVVDDRTVRGIQIGNKLGCQTAWIWKGEYAHEVPNKKTGQPTKIINSVEDLLHIL